MMRFTVPALLCCLALFNGCSGPTTAPPPFAPESPITKPGRLEPGNEGGNGGDTLTILNHGAWFLTSLQKVKPFSGQNPDSRSVSVCLRKTSDFGVSEEEARLVVNDSFFIWRRYLESENISFRVRKEIYRPATSLRWVECREQPDLEIILGATDAKLEKDRAHFVNPIGYAWQSKHDVKSGWGAGYIWIAPARSQTSGFPRWGSGREKSNDTLAEQAHFRQLMLHEVGHVLGCDHVPGTIMREDILASLIADPDGSQFAQKYKDNLIRHNQTVGPIEDTKQLLHSRTCYKLEEEGDCLSLVEHRALYPNNPNRPYLEDSVRRLLFGSFEPETAQFEMALWALKQGGLRCDLRYLTFGKHSPNPGEINLKVFLPDLPITHEDRPVAFKMKLDEAEISFPAAADDVLNGEVEINGKTYTALFQRSARVNGLSQLWIVVDGRRLRLD